MRQNAIGETGVKVTELGFGASALGSMPDTYGYAVDESRARETLHAIFESEVNWIDTARAYGFGESEARIGRAIAERGGLPQGFVISTKLDRDVETGRFDADRARRSLEESLTALGLDRVDILHLHDPEHARDEAEIAGPGGAIEALLRMKEEGLTRAVGLAMGEVGLFARLLEGHPFDCLITHNRFTLVNRNAEALIEAAHARGIAVLNAAPFAGGVLAKGSAEMPRLTYQEASGEALAPVREVERLCARHSVAPGAAALRFSMREPRVAATIAGVSRPERVRQTLAWAHAAIPEELWHDLAALPVSTGDPEAERAYRPG